LVEDRRILRVRHAVRHQVFGPSLSAGERQGKSVHEGITRGGRQPRNSKGIPQVEQLDCPDLANYMLLHSGGSPPERESNECPFRVGDFPSGHLRRHREKKNATTASIRATSATPLRVTAVCMKTMRISSNRALQR